MCKQNDSWSVFILPFALRAAKFDYSFAPLQIFAFFVHMASRKISPILAGWLLRRGRYLPSIYVPSRGPGDRRAGVPLKGWGSGIHLQLSTYHPDTKSSCFFSRSTMSFWSSAMPGPKTSKKLPTSQVLTTLPQPALQIKVRERFFSHKRRQITIPKWNVRNQTKGQNILNSWIFSCISVNFFSIRFLPCYLVKE